MVLGPLARLLKLRMPLLLESGEDGLGDFRT